ncbi:uncharacterized protein LOC135812437 [Sycon ciliatum]|uniref:uncharacterized protein LOC135812437 n=1 Tax=Sycon ciliatum TaxID=27933 RepID=UPI0031F688AF
MGILSLSARLVTNMAVLVGSSMILYGILDSRSHVYKLTTDGDCLLWGTTTEGSQHFLTGPSSNCRYAVGAAIVSTLMALLTSIRFIYRAKQGTPDRHSWTVLCDVFFMICMLIVAIVTTIVISAGLLVFCKNLSKAVLHKTNCKDIYLTKKSGDVAGHYAWHNSLSVAQIGSWIVSLGWFVHMILAVVDYCIYRKQRSSAARELNRQSGDRVAILDEPEPS